jgi:alpha-L-rhamnosidase
MSIVKVISTTPASFSNTYTMSASEVVTIAEIRCEHGEALGIDVARPRLSWKIDTQVDDWRQGGYELQISKTVDPTAREDHTYYIDSEQSILVPWPAEEPDLQSAEQVVVRVRCHAQDGQWTAWSSQLTVEIALLERGDWNSASMITCQDQGSREPQRPFRVGKQFELESIPRIARLYATAWGVYQIRINDRRLSDLVLSPGWTSYKHRLKYQTYDITDYLVTGTNTICADVGEGWYTGRLAWAGRRNIFGERNAFFAKIVLEDKGQDRPVTLITDSSWKWCFGPLITSEIYDGEVYDGRIVYPTSKDSLASWKRVDTLELPITTRLIADAAPVKPIETLKAVQILRSPSGKTIVDFGQNMVGWVRINRELRASPAPSTSDDPAAITLSHAEVLDEHGEIGMSALRSAKCVDRTIVGDRSIKQWTPTFTFHGFRFVQVEGWDECMPGGRITLEDLSAVVLHSAIKRTGFFECSDARLNRLHENVVWSMRGNFLSIPTDCPQRDERLGWTGDMAVFGRTATFLYDTTAMLSSWLKDVAIEQAIDPLGRPPMVVPNVLEADTTPHPIDSCAIWGDVTVMTPWDMFLASGDTEILKEAMASMQLWLDRGVQRDPITRLWRSDTHQFGDWLDPKAPADAPDRGQTNAHLVADAYLIASTARVAQICDVLGETNLASGYASDHSNLLSEYRKKYLDRSRSQLTSHSQAAYSLALHVDIFSDQTERDRATQHLQQLVSVEDYRVNTGFAATPIILEILASHGLVDSAYKMLFQPETPGWMYMLSKDATTMWERWDSLLPDNSLNPSGMTSFNHYALGSVAAFLHHVVGGISPLEPGWRKVLVRPRPGGGLDRAATKFDSPYGWVACRWEIDRDKGEMLVDITIAPNTTATIDLPGQSSIEVGSGKHRFRVVLD